MGYQVSNDLIDKEAPFVYIDRNVGSLANNEKVAVGKVEVLEEQDLLETCLTTGGFQGFGVCEIIAPIVSLEADLDANS